MTVKLIKIKLSKSLSPPGEEIANELNSIYKFIVPIEKDKQTTNDPFENEFLR